MVDTVHFRTHQPLQPSVREKLRLVPRGFSVEGHARASGAVGGMYVHADDRGTLVKGSLPQHLRGENLTPFLRGDVSLAVKKIADDLEISEAYLREARVYRLDYGVNAVVSEPPSAYLRALQDPASVGKRSHGWETATYGSAPFQIEFYDKLLQMRRKHRAVFEDRLREAYEGKHVLRVEARHLRRVPQQFERRVVLGDLDEESFFALLGARLSSETRRFRGAPPVLTGAAGDVKTMMREYQQAGIEAHGGRDAALARITEGAQSGILGRSQAYRQRQAVDRAMAATLSTQQQDLVSELIRLVDVATVHAMS